MIRVITRSTLLGSAISVLHNGAQAGTLPPLGMTEGKTNYLRQLRVTVIVGRTLWVLCLCRRRRALCALH